MSNKRPIDRSKKSNIKCANCLYWDKNKTYTERNKTYLKYCSNSHCGMIWTAYWNRCSHFRWREGDRNEMSVSNNNNNRSDEKCVD